MGATGLEGRRVAITGATGGIGRALAAALHERGASLALTGRREDVLGELATSLTGGVPVLTRVADAAAEEQVAAFIGGAAAELGGLDVLVNLAGFSSPGKVAEASLETFDALIAANVTGTFLASKHFLAVSGTERLIVNVGSMAGLRPNAAAPLYCTAKAALRMFTDALALQAISDGVRVSSVSPGGVATEFWGDRPVDKSVMLTADDVVRALLFVIEAPPYMVVRDLVLESVATALKG